MFLLTYNWMLWYEAHTGLSMITVRPLTPFLKVSATEHALLIFAICMVMLFLPKALALVDLARDKARRRAFGSMIHATVSAMTETAFSTLHAPLQMLWHSQFVAASLLLVGVQWEPQKRVAQGTTWLQALGRHWGHTAIGLIWGAAIWRLDHPAFWWFAPVVAGMVLSIPMSVLPQPAEPGGEARRHWLFVTPEETAPPPELAALRERMGALEASGQIAPGPADAGWRRRLLDPYVNAIHVSLLREKRQNPELRAVAAEVGVGSRRCGGCAETVAQGPAQLGRKEKLLILSDAEAIAVAAPPGVARPSATLSRWWQGQIREYAR